MFLKQLSGCFNGLAFDKDGNLWSCADNRNEIWRISGDKKVETITGSYEGKVFTEYG
jgi:gluconolactonase